MLQNETNRLDAAYDRVNQTDLDEARAYAEKGLSVSRGAVGRLVDELERLRYG